MRYASTAKTTIVVAALFSIILLAGCSKKTDDTVTSSTSASTQSEIESIINQNPEIFETSQEETDENTAYQSIGSGADFQYAPAYYVDAASATLPVAWLRKVDGSPSRNINITENNDSATVIITANWTGKLYIDRTRDGKRNPGTKPIADTGVKKAYFEKIYGLWTLKKVACVDHNLTDQTKQTVDIVQVEAKTATKTYTITDPGNLMGLDTELPTFSAGTQVTVVATVSNTSQTWTPPVFVYLHHGMPTAHQRNLMYDDGTNGDEVAGDGKYTRVYTIAAGDKIYRSVFVDVLDSGCLQTETVDDYNSTAWRIPYKVQ